MFLIGFVLDRYGIEQMMIEFLFSLTKKGYKFDMRWCVKQFLNMFMSVMATTTVEGRSCI